MGDESTAREAPTRRDYLTYGGAVVGGGLLAGCTSEGSPNDEESSSNSSRAGNTTGSTDANTYSVTMAPMGEITFESVPERWIPYGGCYADMGVALGQADGITGIGGSDRYYTTFYEELPGVNVDREKIEENSEVRSKEQFYELENDVHLYDPGMLINWFDWDQQDVDEIAENVGPFLGNVIFRREDEWHDYRYYTLYGAFEKIAQLFREQERYRAFKGLHDEFIADIQKRLPPAAERPSVLLTYKRTTESETFSPYRLNDKGTSKKQWRDLGVKDALAKTGVKGISSTDRGELDFETLLEVDPEVFLIRGHERKSVSEFRDTVVADLRNHPVGSQLTAVENGRVYRGGYLHQGPIHNLFLTEQGAKQMYPEIFGEIASNDQLFDRQRVADIISGEF